MDRDGDAQATRCRLRVPIHFAPPGRLWPRQTTRQRDHIVCWPKPAKPRTIESAAYALLPEFLMVREVLLRLNVPGFRSKTIIVATTLLDRKQAPLDALLELYRER